MERHVYTEGPTEEVIKEGYNVLIEIVNLRSRARIQTCSDRWNSNYMDMAPNSRI